MIGIMDIHLIVIIIKIFGAMDMSIYQSSYSRTATPGFTPQPIIISATDTGIPLIAKINVNYRVSIIPQVQAQTEG